MCACPQMPPLGVAPSRAQCYRLLYRMLLVKLPPVQQLRYKNRYEIEHLLHTGTRTTMGHVNNYDPVFCIYCCCCLDSPEQIGERDLELGGKDNDAGEDAGDPGSLL